MFYATHDSDGLHISENAHIAVFQTEAEAIQYLTECWDSDTKSDVVVEPGHFGDCWIKVLSEPQSDDRYIRPFTLDELHVRRPGSHPGGKQFWIEPMDAILVAHL